MDSRQHLVDVPHRVGEGWALVRREADTAAEQMAIDERLAAQAQRTVRLFRWRRPAVSLGRRQPVPSWANESSLAAHGIERVERPTGGGIALHGSDLSFSVVAPMAQVAIGALMDTAAARLTCGLRTCGIWVEWQREVEPRQSSGQAGRITYCLTEQSPYALMIGRRKVGGLALRRYRASWLVQGSMLMRPLPAVFRSILPEAVQGAWRMSAVSLEEAMRAPLADDALIDALHQAWEAGEDDHAL